MAVIAVLVLVIALLPVSPSLTVRSSRSAVYDARVISLAMFSYSLDHQGAYPTGKSSTDIFQKLLDGRYIEDPTIFCVMSFKMPGKTEATSNVLKPENVCWDVTVPLDSSSSDSLPVVFLTGYRVNYISGGNAVPIFLASDDRPYGLAICYHGNNATWRKRTDNTYGEVPIIDPSFDPAGKTYQQLTPDGPLPPLKKFR